jgi:hypothetical protein
VFHDPRRIAGAPIETRDEGRPRGKVVHGAGEAWELDISGHAQHVSTRKAFQTQRLTYHIERTLRGSQSFDPDGLEGEARQLLLELVGQPEVAGLPGTFLSSKKER